MIKTINIKLYKNNRLEQEYNDIKCIAKDNTFTFNIDNVKSIINNKEFIRETKEYKFRLGIEDKKGYYKLKEKNMLFDIEIEKINYKVENNNIILEYKINTDEEKFKVIIEGVDINE